LGAIFVVSASRTGRTAPESDKRYADTNRRSAIILSYGLTGSYIRKTWRGPSLRARYRALSEREREREREKECVCVSSLFLSFPLASKWPQLALVPPRPSAWPAEGSMWKPTTISRPKTAFAPERMRALCIPVNGSRLLRLLNVYYASAAPVIYGVAGGNGGRGEPRHSRRQRRRNGGVASGGELPGYI
jgi:hypothetical protein